MQLLVHGNPFHEALYALLCANLKATQSLEVFSFLLCSQLATSAHCALQLVLTPLCHFTWPITSWLSCCCSQLLPLCYNTTKS
ncbi:unnamed protein product [Staurois parvus]|uniref:Uncharacterized protein n=1 Tax=Staurois parvus TaxID=386267 RepID=A0ABN9CKM3_9NEOB|nr:unnamed protein product [Staurois parvus]